MTHSGTARVGVYVCHCGGNISDVVDVERVVAYAARLPGVVVAREHPFTCSDPGQGVIAEDITTERLDRVVVAACSPSLHEATFRRTLRCAGLNPYLYEHANLREQVSWCSSSDPDGATGKAMGLVAAAVAKARLLEPLEPLRVETEPRVVVIGGGVAGLTCARAVARRGLAVSLLERRPALGGHVAALGRTFPEERPAAGLLQPLVDEVLQDPAIDVLLDTEVTGVSGSVGAFHLTARQGSRQHEIAAGAIVIATGFDHYEPRPGEYGHGIHPGVITLPELLRRLDPAGPTRGQLAPPGTPVRSLCFIHCVGSRQVEGVHEPGPDGRLQEHCSRVCCTATLRAAVEIRERFPAVQVFDLHQDLRTYGRGHEDLLGRAGHCGVLFLRHAVEDQPVVERGDGRGSAPLVVRVRDTLTCGEEIELPVDLVVLVTGLVPHDISDLADLLKLARSPDGFLQEVHPKLRPVELAVAGVLVAGCCQAPMDIPESCTSAGAAAVKAAALLVQGSIELDPFVAAIDPSRCDGCGACVEECRFVQALSFPEQAPAGTPPEVNVALCKGCGMCAAVCPTGALQIRGWQLDQYDAMVEAIASAEDPGSGERDR